MTDTRFLRLRRKHGLITTAAARQAGFDDRDIARLVRTGAWVAVRRGVYAEHETWTSLDAMHGQQRLRTRAVDLLLPGEHAFSHDSAALEHGLPLLTAPTQVVHVTRRRATRARRASGLAQHTEPFLPGDSCRVDGVPVLGLARTVLDLTREHGYAAGLVAADQALRLGTTRDELAAVRTRMRSWPGIAPADAVLADADPGAESAAETLGRIVLERLGLGEVRTQFPVRLEDGTTAWLDLLVGCHAFEVDGKVKFLSVAEGGVATRPASEVIWDEKKRERLVRARNLGVSRLLWADVAPGSRDADRRLRQEYVQTLRRFGARLPAPMEEYAARLAPLRARRLRAVRRVPPLF